MANAAEYKKVVAKLEKMEKAAATLKANAKSGTEIGRAGALAATARQLRATLVHLGVL